MISEYYWIIFNDQDRRIIREHQVLVALDVAKYFDDHKVSAMCSRKCTPPVNFLILLNKVWGGVEKY